MKYDLVRYMSTFIPSSIVVDGCEYYFQLFINHSHYDIRICYTTDPDKLQGGSAEFLYLTENIDSELSLSDALCDLREHLRKNGLLKGEFAKKEGYTFKSYLRYMYSKKNKKE